MKRFASISDAEIQEKKRLLTPKSTVKSESTAEKNFRAYLLEKGKPIDFERYSKADLDGVLCSFYLEARTKSGELYKKNSLDSFRYGLNRFLKRTGHTGTETFDLLTDPAFTKSTEAFKIAIRELKAAGKAEVKHYEPLSDADRQKLYKSMYFNCDLPF